MIHCLVLTIKTAKRQKMMTSCLILKMILKEGSSSMIDTEVCSLLMIKILK